MKELNLKIESCKDCPYYRVKLKSPLMSIYQPGFSCRKSHKTLRGNENDIHQDCPLKDAREQGVKVGVSVFIFNKEYDEIIIGNRTPDNLWGLPGGGMIAGEIPPKTAAREVLEETGIIINPQKIRFATFTNDVFLEEKNEHWITLYYICNYEDWTGTPEIKEPAKCTEWKWSKLDELPNNLFCDWGKFIPELKKL